MNLPQSPAIMLAMLIFFILFVQQHTTIICSHRRRLQHTSPQYVGLDVHLTNMPKLQTRSSALTKKLRSCAVFSCQAPCQASFRPLPLGLKSNKTQQERRTFCCDCLTKVTGRCLNRIDCPLPKRRGMGPQDSLNLEETTPANTFGINTGSETC